MHSDRRSSRHQLSHDRILDAAARSVRLHGYAGVGVAEVMKEAGLTHGGFYAHFKSRDALLAAAVGHAGAESGKALSQRMAALRERGASPVAALVEAYFAPLHVQAIETGCPVAALGAEMPRQADEVRMVSCQSVSALVELARSALPPECPKERAFALASSLVGAVQLARALGEPGHDMLQATGAALIAQYDPTS